MSKKAKLYLGLMVLFLTVLVNSLFLMPQIAQQAGEPFSPPKTLNALFLVGFFGSMFAYGLERHNTKQGKDGE